MWARNTVLATTLAIGAMAGAAAQSTATATVGTLTFELIDLDPGDGLAPAVHFVGPNADFPSQISGFARGLPYDYLGHYSQNGSSAYAGLTRQTDFGASSTRVAITGGPSLEVLGVHSDTSVLMLQQKYNEVLGQGSTGSTRFVLAPMTGIRFKATSHLAATTVMGDGGVVNEAVLSASFLRMWTLNAGYYTSDSNEQQVAIANNAIWHTDDMSERHQALHRFNDTSLALEFDNYSPQSSEGNVSFGAWTYGVTLVPAVPEPSTAWCLGAGLALLALARRRARKGTRVVPPDAP